ncbi:hypothetical protein [Tenacibaculum retecalamus]|uniref:hypothetical protein n=1 Tax=Tenacibaculum retecalamus TaxID=3018315 RepID=UPI0023D8E91D|nr:hypothetical protein [Tenacibaculum retecalamus]WBX70396.1 hypothetical protein PG912_08910 [Tenacibaculum retecalamus]
MADQKFIGYFDAYQKTLIKWRKSLPNDTFENRQMIMSSYNDDIIPKIPNNFDSTLKDFFSNVKSWKVKWILNPKLELDIEGTINILPIEEVLIGDTDFLPDKFPVMKNFTLLDFFYNEAAVGFYLDKPENGLYYFEFDANPQKLNLDFKGYLEMLKYTKGAAYWQKSIIEPITDRKTSTTIEKLNKLFPEVTIKGFYELYDSIRINK